MVQRLDVFVRDHGGGLIFAAGQNTYGQEGYAKSEMERLLPVKFEAKRKREDLDLVLLIDRSSSMRGPRSSSRNPPRWPRSICWTQSTGWRSSRSIRSRTTSSPQPVGNKHEAED